MIDINLIRENRELVKENIKKKFKDDRIPLVDEVYELDIKFRNAKKEADDLRNEKNKLSSEIGFLIKENKVTEIENNKKRISEISGRIKELEELEEEYEPKIKSIMYKIPNIIDESVPIGKDDSENVEIERFGEATVPSYEVPYHADILEKLSGLDKESAGRISGNGFYYLMGNVARLHSAMLSYARDFMIEKGFTYCVPPFMIRSDVVNLSLIHI